MGAWLALVAWLFIAPALAQQDDAARLSTLEQQLGALSAELAQLEDSKAIKRLQRAYGYYVDQKLADEIATLFTEDATVEIGGMGVYVGRERIAEFYQLLMDGPLDDGDIYNHMILQGVVHIGDDGDSANGRWRALIQIGVQEQAAVWAEGPYENEYVRDQDGVWRFSKVHWYQTLAAPYSPGWHLEPWPLDAPSEELPPDRPPSEVYESFPGAYMTPFHYDNPATGQQSAATAAATAPSAGTRNGDAAERLNAARTSLAALDQRAMRIADQNEIENLQRIFGFYFDKMLWAEVLDLFSDDATVEIGASGVYFGKDSIRDYLYGLSGGVEGPLEGELFEHLQLQPIITIADNGQTARGRWRTLIMTGTSGSGSGGSWGEGPYENEYVREDGVWKISKLRWYGTFIAPYEGGWLETDPEDLIDYSTGSGTTPDQPSTSAEPDFHYPNPGRSN